MKLDTFIQLIKDLRTNQITDDTDPNNVLLNQYTNPFDKLSLAETLRIRTVNPSSLAWGDGTTYTAYDTAGNAYTAPSCGWLWGSGGKWG